MTVPLSASSALTPACLSRNRAITRCTTRCEAEQTWLAAWRAPTGAAASDRYDAAAQRYAARLAEGHPALADLALMRVELDERAGRRTPAARAAALAQWQRAFGRDWPGRLVVLH